MKNISSGEVKAYHNTVQYNTIMPKQGSVSLVIFSHNWNQWKLDFFLIQIIMEWSLPNFTHDTAAVLSWHVQSLVVIRWPRVTLQQKTFHWIWILIENTMNQDQAQQWYLGNTLIRILICKPYIWDSYENSEVFIMDKIHHGITRYTLYFTLRCITAWLIWVFLEQTKHKHDKAKLLDLCIIKVCPLLLTCFVDFLGNASDTEGWNIRNVSVTEGWNIDNWVVITHELVENHQAVVILATGSHRTGR